MQLARFLNKVFTKGGFVLTDAFNRDYIIGSPKGNPIKLKILNSNLPVSYTHLTLPTILLV